MNLDELLATLRQRRLLLINADEVWPAPGYTRDLQRAVRRHRQGLELLIRWSSTDVCPARDLHRKYWKYAGGGRYECEVCKKISA